MNHTEPSTTSTPVQTLTEALHLAAVLFALALILLGA